MWPQASIFLSWTEERSQKSGWIVCCSVQLIKLAAERKNSDIAANVITVWPQLQCAMTCHNTDTLLIKTEYLLWLGAAPLLEMSPDLASSDECHILHCSVSGINTISSHVKIIYVQFTIFNGYEPRQTMPASGYCLCCKIFNVLILSIFALQTGGSSSKTL